MLLLLGIICVFYGLVIGDEQAAMKELKDNYMKIVIQCMTENPVSENEIYAIQNNKIPESQNVKCLFACAFKKTGMMDDRGYFSVDGVLTDSRKYLGDNPAKMKLAEEFAELCKSVNNVAVSDGEKGCDRALLIYNCSLEKAPDFAELIY